MTDTVRFELRGPLGLVTLSRPRALNALDLPMFLALRAQLDAWAEDARVRAVVLRSDSERAFCAGGDVRSVATAAPDAPGEPLVRAFFRHEYGLNHRIHHYPKPVVSLVEGVCMGGGLGLSAHGSHRVVGERLVLAMPETALGFFPDVGGGWFLPRFPGEAGTYLGLTGARANAADALWLGYATHHVPFARFEAVIAALAEALATPDARPPSAHEAVTRTLAAFHQEAGPSALAAGAADLDRLFGHTRVEHLLEALAREPGEWAAQTRATLLRMCPTSLRVTLRLLRSAEARHYDTDVVVEFRLSQHLARRADFREGVRAVLVDKDHAARWSPASLAEVSDADVDALFAPLPAGEELRLS
ncbi:enoyl-CoA hydratase/isomerase family protein [Aggregicoccus sp. 17bor-14]|uniref:enoyl-CoA hydratase/isomerase family protein n=1 Tax=Myxococcaceae TaxID=31 RepID=UPI00129CD1A9|nr:MULTISPECIES: enoyl-CoA hydratase/isomerase family protein [Myxococcaceae]MBF5045766.1 enoyl-CoA hydratase/isomerase family protein [Simulacricoccus sp. 17bor-14]MRI91501.1 enoyl-CoA hydratase/isomerase family protein [Aggregicoccus sp. 17bor-14]